MIQSADEHDRGAMRDHHHGMAAVDQCVQGLEQLEDVDGMEAGGRLVEKEERVRGMARRVGARPATGP